MAKKRRLVLAQDQELDHYFDRLPDEIVWSIVDRLCCKDAAKTCLLSHRFHHVSKTSFLHRKNLDFEDSSKEFRQHFNFVESVNQILHMHEGSKVDSLHIAIKARLLYQHRLPHQTNRDIDSENELKDSFKNWVTFARAKSVQSLYIDFVKFSSYSAWYNYCPMFLTFEGWDKLTDLSLKRVHVDDEDLEHGIKSHLVNLESLNIESSRSLKMVKVASSKLNKLEIRGCDNIRTITIDFAPNLQLFIFEGEPYNFVTVSFKVVPKLSHVSLGGGALTQDSLSELQKVKMLEKLELLGDSTWAETFFPQFAMFKSWDLLTDLTLKSVNVSDEDLKQLLVNLESLCIENSSLLEKVVVKSPKLKRLERSRCRNMRMIDIESTPNLEYLCYRGLRSNYRGGFVHVKGAPKLSEVLVKP